MKIQSTDPKIDIKNWSFLGFSSQVYGNKRQAIRYVNEFAEIMYPASDAVKPRFISSGDMKPW